MTKTCPFCLQQVETTEGEKGAVKLKPHNRPVYGDEINLRGGKRETPCVGGKCSVMA